MATRQLYYPVEQALLADFFDLPRPEALRSLNIWEPDPISPRKAVHVEADSSGDRDNEWALPNAVARIALSRIQNRLPQWYARCGNEETTGRTYRQAVGRDVLLLPLHLFTINWADSAPGFSWPEAYHLTWFPVFDRYVVTASADSTGVWGYEDRALGHFGMAGDRISQARKIVTTFWRDECNGGETGPWAYLFDTGAVGSAEAYAWAEDVWEPAEEIEED